MREEQSCIAIKELAIILGGSDELSVANELADDGSRARYLRLSYADPTGIRLDIEKK
ncbi:MAG: hypothetical protein ACLUD0_02870 [Eubacterium ramulus]